MRIAMSFGEVRDLGRQAVRDPRIAVLAVVVLAGCVPPAQETVMVITPPPPQTLPPPITPPEFDPAVPEVNLRLEDGLPVPANAACMSAVAERTGNYNVQVLGNEAIAEGTEVMIGVGEEMQRWRCVAQPSGEVVDVDEVRLLD